MNKVICDVCGTDYPETASNCPICGCARAGGQTSAGNTVAGEEEKAAYTYVKGGRFSKANVRKRLKGAQVPTAPKKTPAPKEPEVEQVQEPEEEEEERSSNVGLIVIVILLLLAIIAVAGYIAVSIFDIDFGLGKGDEPSTSQTTQVTLPDDSSDPTNESTQPTEPTVETIPCTNLILSNSEETLTAVDSVLTLEFTREPSNTTDKPIFTSSDESVAVVDENGRVTAVGKGVAIISVECGDAPKRKCKITCDFEEPMDTNQEYILKINGAVSRYGDEHNADVSIKVGEAFKLTLEDADGNKQDVEWVVSADGYVTIDGTTVKGAAKTPNAGIKISITIGEYDYICVVRVS